MKLLYRKLHRWLTLLFALPLALVLVSGLVLSVEPIVQRTPLAPGSVTLDRLAAIVEAAGGDPAGLAVLPHAGKVVVGGGRGGRTFDLATGLPADPDPLAALFGTMRGLHERLLLDLGWLVTASTVALLVLIVLGVLMGLPRLRNSLAGWHKGIAWFGLPLLVLSPLTGLALALGVTFSGPPPAAAPAPSLARALALVAADHDLDDLSSIRRRGPVLMARIWDGGELRAYAVTAGGTVPVARQWPRLLHEGNGAALLTGPLNVAISLALIGLLGTGLTLWARRQRLVRRPSGAALRQAGRVEGATSR